jgi:hypothetical protein
MAVRRQLTLFAPPEASGPVEAVRQAVDPIQHRLIRAHVTLCREEDLVGCEAWQARLATGGLAPLSLRFGAAEAFSGHGLYLPCREGEAAFQTLREAVLGSAPLSRHRAHLTLAHPRNPRAPGNSLAAAAALGEGLWLTFPSVTLIEQTDGRAWRELETWRLGGGA